jgi:choline dehydrogenase-like flavoprotein
MAILSQNHRGRSACIHCGFCEFFGCEVGAKSSTLATVIPEAEKTGRCEIRSDSYVRKIETDKRGRVTGVIYFDADRKEVFQRAKAVVVCANGAETPRLLLLSKSSLFPNGLGNSSGLVGKYLMFNSGAAALGLFERELNEYKSIAVTRVIHDFYDSDPRRGFYGGGGLDTRFDVYPIGFALGAYGSMPKDTPTWGVEFKKMLREYFTRSMYVIGHATSLPVETNTVTLDDRVKDAWGLPALRITYRDHPDDLKTSKFFLDRGMELLDAAGAIKRIPFPVEEQSFGFHLLGTCRMGNDPKASVVDRNHRAHDVPNLFVCDGSSFVTSGRGQPTMTIQALAYRAAEQMIRMAKAGEIKTS